MSPKNNFRRPFVFVLKQNFAAQLAAGRLVYPDDPVDLTVRLKPIFFIGIGRSRLITGPYQLVGSVEYCPDGTSVSMTRMKEADPVYGIWQELTVSCPYQIRFCPLVPIKYGITWDAKFCAEFSVNLDDWKSLIQVSLTEHQINNLAGQLTKLNPA